MVYILDYDKLAFLHEQYACEKTMFAYIFNVPLFYIITFNMSIFHFFGLCILIMDFIIYIYIENNWKIERKKKRDPNISHVSKYLKIKEKNKIKNFKNSNQLKTTPQNFLIKIS